MAQENVTELHLFGIPTAYFDLFPKGVPVIIRTVEATALLCILYPDVAHLALRRIADNEFQLILGEEAIVSEETITQMMVTLLHMGVAAVPITIHQVREGTLVADDGTIMTQYLTVASMTTSHEPQDAEIRRVQEGVMTVKPVEIEVDFG